MATNQATCCREIGRERKHQGVLGREVPVERDLRATPDSAMSRSMPSRGCRRCSSDAWRRRGCARARGLRGSDSSHSFGFAIVPRSWFDRCRRTGSVCLAPKELHMPEQILYTAVATSTRNAGRNGHVRSTDGLIDTDVRFPGRAGRHRWGDQPRAAVRRRLCRVLPLRAQVEQVAARRRRQRLGRHGRGRHRSEERHPASASPSRCAWSCPVCRRKRPKAVAVAAVAATRPATR